MQSLSFAAVCLSLWLWAISAHSLPTDQKPLPNIGVSRLLSRNVSSHLFYELEELARIVDITYCVGTTGIQKPFMCVSRCQDFEGFQLVKVCVHSMEREMITLLMSIFQTWNTGPLLADSCGYIVVSHAPYPKRIIIAFRGTYSITNTVIDLSTVPQEYVPYPEDGQMDGKVNKARRCTDCTVHAGFMMSWRNTRSEVLPELETLVNQYPDYQITLVGHSLGGAVAALAGLELKGKGWNPKVTTFGEPKIGNEGLMAYIDAAFPSHNKNPEKNMYRRVTHINDPVPLLPLKEWNFKMHAGEIYISKPDLSPKVHDLQHCDGDEDILCISGADPPPVELKAVNDPNQDVETWLQESNLTEFWNDGRTALAFPSRFKLWQLFFSHRDYFWRLGVCIPGGDPLNWHIKYPPPP